MIDRKGPSVTERRLLLSRRGLLIGSAASLVLGGCDRLYRAPTFQQFLSSAERLTYGFQRLAVSRTVLAPEYSPKDIAKKFRPNGSQDSFNLPPDYPDHQHEKFARWKVDVGGLVMRPMAFSVADLRALPSRTQITRHDCVEGWSCIGQWTGTPLGNVLMQTGLQPSARFIVFHCADEVLHYVDGEHAYYESIDLIDAFHPQTILAYELNGAPLPLANGAPLRLRVERQLGYKMAKFITRIEAVDRLDNIRGGKGGYWEDDGYEWYAGI
jgi:DMSO/TMAO reductase YedYZ molybdopterin-dependent catalytic subunit